MQTIKQFLLSLIVVLLAPAALAAPDPESIVFGMGCFWGAEKRMAAIPGVLDVESGYAGGDAETVDYYDVLSLERKIQQGESTARNHAEVVKVTYDPEKVTLKTLLMKFWENHDPTQGDRQGNDIGSNYRSAIYYTREEQKALALQTRDVYQAALRQAGYPPITTEIAPLRNYNRAEAYHQDYLKKNPRGYCGLGGTGVPYPESGSPGEQAQPLSADELDLDRQLIVFESEYCPFCRQFENDILDQWQARVPVARTMSRKLPPGWQLKGALVATPTIVLFEKGREISRHTGYKGDPQAFWQWLGKELLTPRQQDIAFEHATERRHSSPYLHEKRPGTYVDPISGAPLFRSESKFDSGSGWPSFSAAEEGAVTLHRDRTLGMQRVEVRSASSGIHLGHLFEDGPAPTHKRYCINGSVLRFVPDTP